MQEGPLTEGAFNAKKPHRCAAFLRIIIIFAVDMAFMRQIYIFCAASRERRHIPVVYRPAPVQSDNSHLLLHCRSGRKLIKTEYLYIKQSTRKR